MLEQKGKYNVVLKEFLGEKSQIKIYSERRNIPNPNKPKKTTKKNINKDCPLFKIQKKREYEQYIERLLLDSDFADREANKHLGFYSSEKSIRTATSRAKNKIYDYARSNHFDLFITLTGDSSIIDRFDYAVMSKRVRVWLNNIKRDYSPDLKYLIVPEPHNSSQSQVKCADCGEIYYNNNNFCPSCSSDLKLYAWHFHGVLGNLGNLKLEKLYKNGELWVTPAFDVIDDEIKQVGVQQVYGLESYKFGYTTATYIRDLERCSKYITSYITETTTKLTPKGSNRYFRSSNLELPKLSYLDLDAEYKEKFVDSINDLIEYEKKIEVNIDCHNEEIFIYELDKYNYSDFLDFQLDVEENKEQKVIQSALHAFSEIQGVGLAGFGGYVNPLLSFQGFADDNTLENYYYELDEETREYKKIPRSFQLLECQIPRFND